MITFLDKDSIPSEYRADSPNGHMTLANMPDGPVSARCSIWWENTPAGPEGKIGTIGHFYADRSADATALIDAACQKLKANGCSYVLAPMNGNTWRSYRYAVENEGAGGEEPSRFLMEPERGRGDFFTDSGFTVCNTYYSYIEKLATAAVPAHDFVLRSPDMAEFEKELEIVYDISVRSFSTNPYYTDIDKQSFITQYNAIKPAIIADLVIIAYKNDSPAGFVFCIPDRDRNNVIFKTIAVLPEFRGRGLGRILIESAKQKALDRGFKNCIYALIHKDNISRNFGKNARLLRTYELYGKNL